MRRSLTLSRLPLAATPLAAQAAALADAMAYYRGAGSEDASFWRLRELSARWELAPGLATSLGASTLALTLAGRDLLTWTRFPGIDPEIDDAPRSAVTRTTLTGVPVPRQLMVRVEPGY